MRNEPEIENAEKAERDRRRRLAWLTLLLLVGLPIYLIVAASLAAALNPPLEDGSGRTLSGVLELLVYIGLGVVWAWPLKRLTMGVGRKR